jgi:hypothetical protein
MRLRKKYGRRRMKRRKRKSGGGWEGGGKIRGAEVRMVALRGSVTRQSTAGIRHMFVETGREPGLVEENVFCHDRFAEARQPYEVSGLFQVVTSADVDSRFAAGFELALALQFCGGF